jgi:hypothetical protein
LLPPHSWVSPPQPLLPPHSWAFPLKPSFLGLPPSTLASQVLPPSQVFPPQYLIPGLCLLHHNLSWGDRANVLLSSFAYNHYISWGEPEAITHAILANHM